MHQRLEEPGPESLQKLNDSNNPNHGGFQPTPSGMTAPLRKIRQPWAPSQARTVLA